MTTITFNKTTRTWQRNGQNLDRNKIYDARTKKYFRLNSNGTASEITRKEFLKPTEQQVKELTSDNTQRSDNTRTTTPRPVDPVEGKKTVTKQKEYPATPLGAIQAGWDKLTGNDTYEQDPDWHGEINTGKKDTQTLLKEEFPNATEFFTDLGDRISETINHSVDPSMDAVSKGQYYRLPFTLFNGAVRVATSPIAITGSYLLPEWMQEGLAYLDLTKIPNILNPELYTNPDFHYLEQTTGPEWLSDAIETGSVLLPVKYGKGVIRRGRLIKKGERINAKKLDKELEKNIQNATDKTDGSPVYNKAILSEDKIYSNRKFTKNKAFIEDHCFGLKENWSMIPECPDVKCMRTIISHQRCILCLYLMNRETLLLLGTCK